MRFHTLGKTALCLVALATAHAAQTSQIVTVRKGGGGSILAPDFNCCGAGDTLTIKNFFGSQISVNFNMTGGTTIQKGAQKTFNTKAATTDFYDVIDLMNPMNLGTGNEINNCKAGTSVAFNGTGMNASILTSVSVPHTGRSWSVRLDCTGASTGGLALFHLDYSGLPVTPTIGPRGELLVDLTASSCLLFAQPHAGGVATLGPTTLPIDPALACLSYRVQGLCGSAPIGFLSNALDEVVGR